MKPQKTQNNHTDSEQNKTVGEIQDGDGDRATDLVSSWPRNSTKKLETHLTKVKHQGEQKTWHSKHLDLGRFLHAMIK
jgi:hypothetical protein